MQGFASLACHVLECSGREVAEFVFEESFAVVFPILDRIFLELEAGYMEFMAVLDILRVIVDGAFAQQPSSIPQLKELVENCYQDWRAQRLGATAAAAVAAAAQR